jgi:hypothetical protein
MKPSILLLAYGKGAASQFEDDEAQVATANRGKACSPRDRAKP